MPLSPLPGTGHCPMPAPHAPGMAWSPQPTLAADCPSPTSPRLIRRHLGELSCSVRTRGGYCRGHGTQPGNGTSGAAGTTCTAALSLAAQAGEANRPHQRSSPLSGLIPGHRGRFADSARLPLKEAETKVNAGLKKAASQPAPSSEGRAQVPRQLPGKGTSSCSSVCQL